MFVQGDIDDDGRGEVQLEKYSYQQRPKKLQFQHVPMETDFVIMGALVSSGKPASKEVVYRNMYAFVCCLAAQHITANYQRTKSKDYWLLLQLMSITPTPWLPGYPVILATWVPSFVKYEQTVLGVSSVSVM